MCCSVHFVRYYSVASAGPLTSQEHVMKHLRTLPILAVALAVAACADTPTAPRSAPDQAAFDGTNPPPDSTGRGVYAGGGQ